MTTRIAAEDYLEALAAHGIDYLFANPGTDFAPVIEAFERAAHGNRKVPRPIVVPHENAAVCMAHGFTMVSGQPQAVMTHVNVGLANALNALIDASRDRVPMLLTSGRTPITERGAEGTRNVYIHWAQEMFDQAGMLREIVKWDYELRLPDQIAPVLDRALAIAKSEPKGPVYLTLPREVLAAPAAAKGVASGEQAPARAAAPALSAIGEAAAILAVAERPVVITASLGRDPLAVSLLASLAERFALPVVSHIPKTVCLPSDHPMHLGYDPAPFLAEADAVLVLECDVPWIPDRAGPRADAKVIHLGVDPLFARYPLRG